MGTIRNTIIAIFPSLDQASETWVRSADMGEITQEKKDWEHEDQVFSVLGSFDNNINNNTRIKNEAPAMSPMRDKNGEENGKIIFQKKNGKGWRSDIGGSFTGSPGGGGLYSPLHGNKKIPAKHRKKIWT